MAAPTNFIAPAGDLNTIFAPINQVDYGTLDVSSNNNSDRIYEKWVSVANISSVSPFNNIGIENGIENSGRSFRVHKPGLYRLCINLNFGDAQDATKQTVVFILSSSSSAPSGSDPKTNYSFTPRPNLSEIYAINCSGASSNIDSGYFQNSLNNFNIGNCFGLNYYSDVSLNQRPYFFTFILQNDAANKISASNFYTLDITFKTPDDVSSTQYKIFPYIRCADDSDSNPYVTLQNAKWLFTKLSE